MDALFAMADSVNIKTNCVGRVKAGLQEANLFPQSINTPHEKNTCIETCHMTRVVRLDAIYFLCSPY